MERLRGRDRGDCDHEVNEWGTVTVSVIMSVTMSVIMCVQRHRCNITLCCCFLHLTQVLCGLYFIFNCTARFCTSGVPHNLPSNCTFPTKVYRVAFPAVIPADRLPSQDQVRELASTSILGLNPETFYELFPFRKSSTPLL